jgi:hypothetical protein
MMPKYIMIGENTAVRLYESKGEHLARYERVHGAWMINVLRQGEKLVACHEWPFPENIVEQPVREITQAEYQENDA